VLRAAGQTQTTQENIQDWLDLDEGDPGFQLLTEEEIAAVILFIFISTTCIIKFPIYLFSKYFLSFRTIVFFINPDYRLTRLTSPPINLDLRWFTVLQFRIRPLPFKSSPTHQTSYRSTQSTQVRRGQGNRAPIGSRVLQPATRGETVCTLKTFPPRNRKSFGGHSSRLTEGLHIVATPGGSRPTPWRRQCASSAHNYPTRRGRVLLGKFRIA
jgi:hypothetical protein